ncbi:amino acid ABC transporter permease [Paenibacillus tyrfis]|uniref:Cysteine ABC transporter permease n=1 Tax=Paenibacillus tyrfis TaxID=1501230 RepID=A0A081P2E8_9BACL|nr:amino acid ABC transporter permease [Paenibacillus tyrfis]KEQ24871.1 cysteine ABC transporter permease [Paenibacillus tyrfis]
MGKSFDAALIWEFLPILLSYLHVTLFILAASLFFGVLLGLLIALPRLYNVPVLARIAAVYVSFVRGTPILIQLFLVFYGVPALLQLVDFDISRMNPIVFVIITYALGSAASISEVIRGAVNAVDRGQLEGAYAVGMTGPQAFFRIVLPQAFVIAFPNFASTVIGFLKDTSLAYSIGVMDMMGRGQTLIATTAHTLEVYIGLTIVYYLTVLVLEKGFALTEIRLQRHEQRIASA